MHFMYDLDSTLVDTRAVRPYMKTRPGRLFAAQNINQITTTADDVLKRLVEKQHKKGEVSIVTDSPEDYAHAVLQKHGFPGDIPVYAVANKPFNNGLSRAITDCRKPLEEIVVIGDSAKDILDAHMARVKSIGVTWGKLFIQEQLSLAEPTAIAESPEDLEKKLYFQEVAGNKYEPRRNPISLLYLPREQISSTAPETTNISIGQYTSWNNGQDGFSELSSRILKFKMIKDLSLEELNQEASDEYFSGGALKKGDSFLQAFWSLKEELLSKLKYIDFKDCLVVATPNSLPEYCYRTDINSLFVANAFKENGFVTSGRFVFRAYPKPEDHSSVRSPEEMHHKTIGLKKASSKKFKQIIIFDDVRTRGTQSTALARTLRYFEFGDKFYVVTFGQTG